MVCNRSDFDNHNNILHSLVTSSYGGCMLSKQDVVYYGYECIPFIQSHLLLQVYWIFSFYLRIYLYNE